MNLMISLMQTDWVLQDGSVINIWNKGWRAGWNQRRKALGVCSPRRKDIRLSYPICKQNLHNMAQLEDTIRHEIAHALDVIVRGRYDHGPAWQRMCKITGARPERAIKASIITDELPVPYILSCPSCGYQVPKFRKPKRTFSCGQCYPGSFNPNYELKLVKQ